MPRLVLYQPDIPQNCGALLRLGACLGVPVEVIEPCGFRLDDKRLRRAGMDYLATAELVRHGSWERFEAQRKGRLLLLTTKASTPYFDCDFQPGDAILLGRESAGVPEQVHRAADLRLRIPLRAGMRSINVAQAAAMVLGEALRQVGGFNQDSQESAP